VYLVTDYILVLGQIRKVLSVYRGIHSVDSVSSFDGSEIKYLPGNLNKTDK